MTQLLWALFPYLEDGRDTYCPTLSCPEWQSWVLSILRGQQETHLPSVAS